MNFIWFFQIIVAFLLILLVLLHSPKGDGLAGIGGAAHIFASQKNAETGLNKLTTYVTIVFVICSLILMFIK